MISIRKGSLRPRTMLRAGGGILVLTLLGLSLFLSPLSSVLANEAANLDQCANGPPGSHVSCTGANWQNGNLNPNNSHWRENDSVPFRARITGLTGPAGTEHVLNIQYDNTESSGKHAYDYLTSYNRTATDADPCSNSGISPCSSGIGMSIPTDPNLALANPPVAQVPGSIDIFNGAITGVSYYNLPPSPYGASIQTSVTITFTATQDGNSSGVIIVWGGHIASSLDWGAGNSASSVSGSPYHVRTLGLDGAGGNQDRSIKASAVLPPPTIRTQVNPATISLGQSVTDTAYLTGTSALGVISGTLNFYACGPTAAAQDCVTGGATVGTVTLPVTSGFTNQATSPPFTPPSAGYYCFRVTYFPGAQANYSPGQSTTKTNECVNVASPSLAIEKVAGAATVSAGDTIGYTIVVTNTGAGTATNVTVSDTLPATGGLNWSISPPVNGCSISNGVLTCNFGDLAPGASASVHITSPTTAATCGTVTNRASVSAGNATTVESNLATITINCPNLVVLKTADSSPINAGDTAAFTIVLTNTGTGIARGVTVSDTLPPGISWTINPSVSGCGITGNLLSCSLGDLASGATRTIHVSGVTTAANCATLSNTATAAATNEPADSLADNSSTAAITVQCPDVTIQKVASDGTVNAGDPIAFTITVNNAGPGTAYNVVVQDTLPANPGLSWSINGGTGAGNCSIAAGVLTCTFSSLASGTSRTVNITSPTSAATCGLVSNTATVTVGNQSGSIPEADAQISVNCAIIQIDKVADAGTVSAGDTIGYTIVVMNTGAGTAYNVVASDTLPAKAGLDWTISPPVNGCSISNGVLTCNFGNLAPNGTASVHITSPTTAATCDTLNNTAEVTTDNDGSASASAAITVNCPNVTVVKSADNSPISAGDTARFTIEVTNSGLGTARNVALQDALPAGITWAVDPVVPGCDINGDALTCSFGDMNPSDSVTVHIHGTTSALACAGLSNTATVSLDNQFDPPAPSTATITVQCPNVYVQKTADVETIRAGDTAAFTIVGGNSGAGNAYNVTLNDSLPGGIAWAISPAVTGCAITGNTLTCTFASLASGASVSVHVSGVTHATECGTLNNTAMVGASNEPEGSRGDNTAEAAITVQCLKIIVVVCTENDNRLYSSFVTVDGVTRTSLPAGSPGESTLCGAGGATFGSKETGEHPANVNIPTTPVLGP